jgi:hypothetical protein
VPCLLLASVAASHMASQVLLERPWSLTSYCPKGGVLSPPWCWSPPSLFSPALLSLAWHLLLQGSIVQGAWVSQVWVLQTGQNWPVASWFVMGSCRPGGGLLLLLWAWSLERPTQGKDVGKR